MACGSFCGSHIPAGSKMFPILPKSHDMRGEKASSNCQLSI